MRSKAREKKSKNKQREKAKEEKSRIPPDSCLHRGTAKPRKPKQPPPLYRDTRHRKQATSCSECAPLFPWGKRAERLHAFKTPRPRRSLGR
ncbi:hypothetical protein PR202_gb21274 [Eleusine coracana subsp. coracana]|uniref:Uncharacterized protein n=1 Tax=Eleusine coracana subsp. coracana TaxID=191504 RepID=A0AAV5FCP5_ELECO|nr:hypothetical protein PR202_gb21274 [Eleusine coracana subsp. coracana]